MGVRYSGFFPAARSVVAKRKVDPYLEYHTSWLKIRNRSYSQWVGREKLFERERGGDPDFQVWDGRALACHRALLRLGCPLQGSHGNFELEIATTANSDCRDRPNHLSTRRLGFAMPHSPADFVWVPLETQ